MACKFRHTERIGLYVMVLITMIAGCTANTRLQNIAEKIDEIQQTLQQHADEKEKP